MDQEGSEEEPVILRTALLLVLLTIVAGAYVKGRTHAMSVDAAQMDAGSFTSNTGPTPRTIDSVMAQLELRNVQTAVLDMMGDNDLTALPWLSIEPTKDMSAFPDSLSMSVDKGLGAWDGDGYVLYGHDKSADKGTEVLEYYVAVQHTVWAYAVAEDGTVTQHDGILPAP